MSYPNMTKTFKVGINNDVYKFIDLTECDRKIVIVS